MSRKNVKGILRISCTLMRAVCGLSYGALIGAAIM